tara:strand:- start:225 stop:818 length:594 start_codon:yes stop_codon:yes gene_type:complete
MSRIAKENERYLARVKASMDRERMHQLERQQEREAAKQLRQNERNEAREMRNDQRNFEKQQRDERNMKITQSNERYSDMWIATTGLSVSQVISLTLRGGDAGHLLNRLELRVYNRSSKTSEDINLINFMKMLHEKSLPNLQVSQRGQVTIDDIVIPARVYFFIKYHWMLSTGQTQPYSLNNENISPSSVAITTKSED